MILFEGLRLSEFECVEEQLYDRLPDTFAFHANDIDIPSAKFLASRPRTLDRDDHLITNHVVQVSKDEHEDLITDFTQKFTTTLYMESLKFCLSRMDIEKGRIYENFTFSDRPLGIDQQRFSNVIDLLFNELISALHVREMNEAQISVDLFPVTLSASDLYNYLYAICDGLTTEPETPPPQDPPSMNL